MILPIRIRRIQPAFQQAGNALAPQASPQYDHRLFFAFRLVRISADRHKGKQAHKHGHAATKQNGQHPPHTVGAKPVNGFVPDGIRQQPGGQPIGEPYA